ncbi:hypothetical protein HMN09_00048300 [Mycena chlorophos]|uniref:Uncharacterized protein n=1 Tax=Mycena chlorophos TaxID=658473 RepID=A0A8H6TS08_MYCCL|nr:hypothetical protein HMN09_00048300 [Mycena chlorophos]
MELPTLPRFTVLYAKDPPADFYNQVVVPNEHKYNLTRFFAELYEFCFPVDFRTSQRRLLDELRQDERTVAATIALFSETWNTIGIEDSQEKIVKLWNTFNEDIQMEMYRDKLNPETSSWDDIVHGAMHAEVITNLGAAYRSRTYESDSGSDSDAEMEDAPQDAASASPPAPADGGRVESTEAAKEGSAKSTKEEQSLPGLASHGVQFASADSDMEILETAEDYSALHLAGIPAVSTGSTLALIQPAPLRTSRLATYARYAELVLHKAQPYPADWIIIETERRFTVQRESETHHVVIDELHGSEHSIESYHFNEPKFQLPLWYARQQVERNASQCTKPFVRDHYLVPLGDPCVDAARIILEAALGSLNPDEPRFQISTNEFGELTIFDAELCLGTYLPREPLQHENFDLLAWYQRQTSTDTEGSPSLAPLVVGPESRPLTPLVDYESSDEDILLSDPESPGLGYPDDEETVSTLQSFPEDEFRLTRPVGQTGAPLGAIQSPARGFRGSASSPERQIDVRFGQSPDTVGLAVVRCSDSPREQIKPFSRFGAVSAHSGRGDFEFAAQDPRVAKEGGSTQENFEFSPILLRDGRRQEQAAEASHDAVLLASDVHGASTTSPTETSGVPAKFGPGSPASAHTEAFGTFPASETGLGDGYGLVEGRGTDRGYGKDFPAGNGRLGLVDGSEGENRGGSAATPSRIHPSARASTPLNPAGHPLLHTSPPTLSSPSRRPTPSNYHSGRHDECPTCSEAVPSGATYCSAACQSDLGPGTTLALAPLTTMANLSPTLDAHPRSTHSFNTTIDDPMDDTL